MPRQKDVKTEVIVREGDRLKLRTRLLHIDIVDGPSAGQATDLAGPEIRIGTGRGCQLVLLDPTVSRHHATLRIESKGTRVIDAGSRNGTWIDGVKIRDGYARTDSTLRLGNSALRLRLGHETVDLPLSSRDRFGALVGKSPAMRQVYTLLDLVADTGDTVLIEGETGTGKELAAEALHEQSSRSAGPFVVFDCSAVSATLLESELFGHDKGAFTGAVATRVGALEAADGGTLFLDEIGELPRELQPKLLRALETLEIRRLGSNQLRQADVRIVTATNRELDHEVAAGRFREDLFYRIAVVQITMPPLRERPEDIPILVAHFAEQLNHTRPGDSPSEATIREFTAQAWPGNVRELRNAVIRARSLGITSSSKLRGPIRPTVDLSVPLKVAKSQIIEQFERTYCLAALQAAGGNATKAADLAGVNRKYLQRAIKRYRLRDPSPRE